MHIIASVILIDNKIKPFDSKLFRSNGILKRGEAIHKFFENQLGEVALLHKKVKEILIVNRITRKVLSTV